MTKAIIESDSGVAYGIGLLLLFILCFMSSVILITPVVNELNGYADAQINDGEMSKQRSDANAFIDMVWFAAPVFSILAGLAWAIIRAIEARSDSYE